MTNGSNNWRVPYSKITWFQRLLATHPNISTVSRHHDIIFEVERVKQKDHLIIFCCDEYTMGITAIQRALHEFGPVNIIYIGGGWCGYERQAKQFCIDAEIGLYVSNEMNGALWKDQFWGYHQTDDQGNPVYFSRSA